LYDAVIIINKYATAVRTTLINFSVFYTASSLVNCRFIMSPLTAGGIKQCCDQSVCL